MFATLAGAYPRPAHLEESGSSTDALVAELLREQMDAGLGLLSDGHVRSADPIVAVASRLHGFRVTAGDGTPGSARVITVAEPRWEESITVEAWRATDEEARRQAAERGLQPLPVKQSIVGPYTLARLADPGDVGRERLTLLLAEALNQELRALAAAGVPVIQVDEDALAGIGADDDAERTLVRDALLRLMDGLESAHLCLAVTGGDAQHVTAPILYDAPFSSYLFDLIAGPDNWRAIAYAPGDRGIVCGVADARDELADEEAVMVWAARYAAALNRRTLDRVGLAPSAGLAHLSRERAKAKIERVAAAARTAALTDDEELKAALDPRAVDPRATARRWSPIAPPE